MSCTRLSGVRGSEPVIFAFSKAFLLLILIVPAVFVFRRSARLGRKTAAELQGRAPEPTYFTTRLVLACLFMAALTVVAARPYIAYDKSASFVFVVDVSRSMQARYSCSEPTFLERAKRVLRDTVQALPEASVGIFAFDRFAFPITQLTTDRTYLADVIDHGLYVGLMLEATQTEIANALSVVAAKKRRLPEIYGDVTHVIVLSDGYVSGDYRRRLQTPFAELAEAGIKVSTVGIGNPEETPIADVISGQCVNQLIEVNGDTVKIPLRADILKFIAIETGGAYYAETETSRLVQDLRSELAVGSVADSHSTGPRRDVSNVFLTIATLALLGFVYLPVRFAKH